MSNIFLLIFFISIYTRKVYHFIIIPYYVHVFFFSILICESYIIPTVKHLSSTIFVKFVVVYFNMLYVCVSTIKVQSSLLFYRY